MTLTTEKLSVVETTKEFRALLKYMRAIAKSEPESVKEKLELEEGLWRYASQKTIKAIVEHIDALEFALAANREAQPVAWRHDDGPFAGMALTRSKSVADSWIANGWTVTPLYAALPVVPDEAYSDDCPDLYPSQSDAWAAGWNACRAAMLTQPVSKGYTLNSPEIPDGCKLVPVEPTRQMMAQGHFAMKGTDRGKFRRIYQAMIAAAPGVSSD